MRHAIVDALPQVILRKFPERVSLVACEGDDTDPSAERAVSGVIIRVTDDDPLRRKGRARYGDRPIRDDMCHLQLRILWSRSHRDAQLKRQPRIDPADGKRA